MTSPGQSVSSSLRANSLGADFATLPPSRGPSTASSFGSGLAAASTGPRFQRPEGIVARMCAGRRAPKPARVQLDEQKWKSTYDECYASQLERIRKAWGKPPLVTDEETDSTHAPRAVSAEPQPGDESSTAAVDASVATPSSVKAEGNAEAPTASRSTVAGAAVEPVATCSPSPAADGASPNASALSGLATPAADRTAADASPPADAMATPAPTDTSATNTDVTATVDRDGSRTPSVPRESAVLAEVASFLNQNETASASKAMARTGDADDGARPQPHHPDAIVAFSPFKPLAVNAAASPIPASATRVGTALDSFTGGHEAADFEIARDD